MTIGPRSQCSVCIRFRSPFDTESVEGPSCEAFPDGIPDEVYFNKLDHRKPVDGDHGLQWKSDGRPFPKDSFVDFDDDEEEIEEELDD